MSIYRPAILSLRISVSCMLALFALFALGPICLRAQGIEGSVPVCDSVVPLLVGETWRDAGAQSTSACFAIEIESSGLLSVELILPATSPRAYLTLGGDDDAAETTVLGRSSTSLLLVAASGNLGLRVASDDPRLPLAPFRLRTEWTDPDAEGEDDTEIELEPNPLSGGCHNGEDDTEIELEPNPLTGGCHNGEDDTEIELEPNPLTGSVSGKVFDLSPIQNLGGPRLNGLCRSSFDRGEGDDDSDGLLCASELEAGREVSGVIANDWGDDVDVFRFEVETLAPVELLARVSDGIGELVAELYDHRGQRLQVEVGDSSTLRLVRTLGPGSFFLALSSQHGTEVAYSVQWKRPEELR